jgi:capsular exopolysaccharide synthesis family protein
MDTVYARFLRRWWWLITIAVIVALAATHYAVGQQTPLYRAQTTVQVGRTIQDKNPEQGEFAIMDRLVPAYAELAKRDPVLIATAQTLDLALTPEQMRMRLLVTRVPSAPLIDIVVVDSDPQRAAAIANEIARQVVLQSPAPSQQDQSAQSFIQQQLTDLQRKISDGQAETVAIQNHIVTLTSAADIEEAKRKLSALEAQVESWQASYARLVAAAEPSKTNLVSILSPAMVPDRPIPERNTLYYALALVIGAGMSILLALGLNLLNSTVATPADVEGSVGNVPLLTIPRYIVPLHDGPIVATAPFSPAAAAYRLLRNILAARGAATAGVAVAVTSSRVAEGKTTTASNLAVALANAGRQVILVDANLHNPEIDSHFAAAMEPGFSDLVLGHASVAEVLQGTAHANLSVVSAGRIPEGYTDLLSMGSIVTVIRALEQCGEIVIFDTPAIAEEQDTLTLTRHVAGVLVVAEAGRVQQDQLRKTLDLLRESQITVLAIALNKVRPPRFSPERLPWSREARNRARARQRRQAHATALALDEGAALKAPGD